MLSLSPRRINWLGVLLTILFAAFALRVFRLNVQSLWYDEAFSVYLAHFDLTEITARTAADIQPPLYYYLLHFWISLAGDGEFALRFLSLFFGVLTIPLLYVAALRLFANRTAAIIAALLATVSPLYVWYSQEARMYTMITFLLLLSSYALLRALQPSPRPSPSKDEGSWWIVFVLANIAAVYTHYFAFVVIVFQLLFTVYCLLFTSYRSQFRLHAINSSLPFITVFATFLPWTPFVIARLGQDASYWQGALKLDEAIRHIFINFTTGESVLESQAQWIAAGWLGCLGVGWLVKLKAASQKSKVENDTSIGFVILYLLIPLILLLFLFYRNPKFNARYLMIASPAFFLLLSIGLASFSRIKNYILRFTLYVLSFSFLLLTSTYADANAYFDPAFTKASFRDVAQFIENHIASDEAIILTSGHLFPAFNYYYHGEAPTIRLPDDSTLNTEHVLGYDTANVLNQTMAGKRGVWVVEWQNEVVDPNGFLPMLLDSQGSEQKIQGTNFYQVRLQHWALRPNAHFSTEPDPSIRHEANFKNAIQLFGLSAPQSVPADLGASFNLYWQALDKLDDDYMVALRIVDAAGNLWGKQDRRLAGYNYPTTRWRKGEKLFGAYTIPLIAGTPAGDYFVEATIYTASNPSGLDVLAPNGAPMGKAVRIGPIKILPPTGPAPLITLNVPNVINQPLGPFTLLGYQLGRDKASAGESIPLTLFWRADKKPDQDYRFQIWFDNSPSAFLPLASPQFPTTQWRAGEIVRSQQSIQIPANTPTGAIQLGLAVSVAEPLGFTTSLGSFTIEKTEHVFVPPNMFFTQKAIFGDNALALVGYDLSATKLKIGDSLQVVLYWQARGKMDKPYTVFVHLLDQNNKPVAQQDLQPVNGTRPTTGWVAQEFIADPYNLTIKPDTTPGKYQIEIGWYDAKDFSRLPVLDEQGIPVSDHVILSTTVDITK